MPLIVSRCLTLNFKKIYYAKKSFYLVFNDTIYNSSLFLHPTCKSINNWKKIIIENVAIQILKIAAEIFAWNILERMLLYLHGNLAIEKFKPSLLLYNWIENCPYLIVRFSSKNVFTLSFVFAVNLIYRSRFFWKSSQNLYYHSFSSDHL